MTTLRSLIKEALSSTRLFRGVSTDSVLPTESEIKDGVAYWRGVRVKYDPKLTSYGRNHLTYISVGDKFFDNPSLQRHTLDHEVAHYIASEVISKDYQGASIGGLFISKKVAPVGSPREGDVYWEGLYGDIGPHALEETLVEAVLEYLSHPKNLEKRSSRVYQYIDNILKER